MPAAASDLRFRLLLALYYDSEHHMLCWRMFKGFVSSLIRDSVQLTAVAVYVSERLDTQGPLAGAGNFFFFL